MAPSYIVKAGAWLEVIVGVVFIAAPDVACTLLFNAKPEGIGRILARWIGISLFALGVACVVPARTLLSKSPRVDFVIQRNGRELLGDHGS